MLMVLILILFSLMLMLLFLLIFVRLSSCYCRVFLYLRDIMGLVCRGGRFLLRGLEGRVSLLFGSEFGMCLWLDF